MESSKIFCEFHAQNAGIFLLKNLNFKIETPDHLFEVEMRNASDKTVAMKLKNAGKIAVQLTDIVAIVQSQKRSKNKTVYFTNRRSDTLCGFSTGTDLSEKWHLAGAEFVEVSRGTFVNRTHLRKTSDKGKLLLLCRNLSDESTELTIRVSRSKKTLVAKSIRANGKR